MASRETEGKLRVADGLVVIALGVVSLLRIWRNAPEAWFGILQSLMAALLIAWGGVILVGKTRAGRLVRTRRRWRYFTLIGVVLATIIAIVVSTSISTERQEANPAAGLLPAIIGLLVAQLYEQERAAQLKASDLSDRDAGVWKRIALAGALVGIVLGGLSGVTLAAGDSGTGFSPAGCAAFPGLGWGDLDNAEVKDQAVAGQTVG
jgi:hypothetical protein